MRDLPENDFVFNWTLLYIGIGFLIYSVRFMIFFSKHGQVMIMLTAERILLCAKDAFLFIN